jgi:hypothetical protein
MTKRTKKSRKSKRFIEAEKNLKRIHKLIGSYEEKDRLAEKPPTRSKWRPGDDIAYLSHEF